MDTGDLRTEALLPVLAPASAAADERRPANPAETRQRRRSRFDREASEDAPPFEGDISNEHKIDRLA
jgi:hypothetical protein